jgi:hypothetical protein
VLSDFLTFIQTLEGSERDTSPTVVDAIKPIPPEVKSAIHRVNDVRNALAHSFFPQNLRRYMVDGKVTYSGTHLFTINGLKKFLEDWVRIRDYLETWLFGATGRRTASQSGHKPEP